MKDDYKLLEKNTDEEEDESEDEPSNKDPDEEDESGSESDDPTKNVDVDEYMAIKGVLTIERIKDIVGEIMSSC